MSNKKPHEDRNIARLRNYLSECAVLLKKNGAFPLSEAGSIAAYGNGVRHTIKGGTGSGEVNSRYFVTVEEGLKQAGFKIVTNDWLNAYDAIREKGRKDFYAGIKKKAKETKTSVIAASMGAIMLEPEYDLPVDKEADSAIYVLSRISGEGNDRLDVKGDYRLTDTEVRDILALDKKFEKFMLVINTGGPVDLTEVNSVGNILVLSQLGTETGCAVADLLLGKTSPSGKLSTSWAAYKDYEIESFGEKDDTFYTEGIRVGYRHFDAVEMKPLYPFGFGLGYSEFTADHKRTYANGTVITVAAEVENCGSYKGKEVVQVYVSAPEGKLEKEVKSLAGYAMTNELAPGEKDGLSVYFDLRDFASYDEKRSVYVLEAGDYILSLGTGSDNTKPVSVLRLAEEYIVRKVANKLTGSVNEKQYPKRALPSAEGLPVIKVDLGKCVTEVIDYSETEYTDPELNGLSNEELAYLNIGSFDPKGGALSIIGNASMSVAGAAGESTSQLKNKGIGVLVGADGPAGLRLSRHYYVDKKGIHPIGSTMPETIVELLPKPVKWLIAFNSRPKRNATIFEQYTTALPIGTAIAQSFNDELARECGDIVGEEMEIFNVDLWLAPALNIHRSVLCGRNFEYFSEDPLLSGKMAAAITKGVQSHKGKGVTIKHYACNNQETNRYGNNSNVNERALREIYLKGFGICIREAKPLAVMSSYNLINGIHTSESRELGTDILRKEFGFEGLLMTDWIVGGGFLTQGSKYPEPNAAKVAASGNTLFMPGSKKDYDEMLVGLKDKTVSAKTLKANAHWLLRVLKERN